MLLTCVRKQTGCSYLTRSLCSHKHSVWLWKNTVFVKAGFRPSAAFHKFSLLTGGWDGGAARSRLLSNTEHTQQLYWLVKLIMMKSQRNPTQVIKERNINPITLQHLVSVSIFTPDSIFFWSDLYQSRYITSARCITYCTHDSQLNVNKLPCSYTSYKKKKKKRDSVPGVKLVGSFKFEYCIKQYAVST